MNYGFIIAAGKQSRFGEETPKALMPYGDGTILDTNIKVMKHFVDEIKIIVNKDNKKFFSKYEDMLVTIESGYGCGDAVMKALNSIHANINDTGFIIWGDSIQDDPNIYDKCLTAKKYEEQIDLVVPVQFEEKPYVKICCDVDNIITVAQFSKYNEVDGPGYHDLSIFYSPSLLFVSAALNSLYMNRWNEQEKKYDSFHSNELVFLDLFNYYESGITGKIVKINNAKNMSFNTLEEYKKVCSNS